MSRRSASNWRNNTANPNMFLNIFFVHHNCMDLIFGIKASDREFFVSRMDAVASQKESSMLHKTMIVLAKAAALTSELTAEAFA